MTLCEYIIRQLIRLTNYGDQKYTWVLNKGIISDVSRGSALSLSLPPSLPPSLSLSIYIYIYVCVCVCVCVSVCV